MLSKIKKTYITIMYYGFVGIRLQVKSAIWKYDICADMEFFRMPKQIVLIKSYCVENDE